MRDDSALLLDMLEASCDAVSYAENLTLTDFELNREKQRAIFNAIQEVGEAAAQLSDEFKQNHIDIPWKKIVGMRNHLVHAYFDIDLESVWLTVQNDLPTLVSQIKPLIPSSNE